MIGIYDCFGYDVPFPERYKLIKSVGFDSVMLWWSDKFGRGEGYQKDALYAKDAGLIIENMHAPVNEQNFISLDNQDGEHVYKSYIQCVKDCVEYEISTMVIHLPNDKYPINYSGMKRIRRIVEQAEKNNVHIAFENLDNINNLKVVMDEIKSENVGFCYDSCHHENYARNINLLEMYGKRLMAVHLHDNGGRNNQHQLPFDGNIDWSKVMRNISHTSYKGTIALEPMNWDYEQITIQKFLEIAYKKAKMLEDM